MMYAWDGGRRSRSKEAFSLSVFMYKMYVYKPTIYDHLCICSVCACHAYLHALSLNEPTIAIPAADANRFTYKKLSG